MRKNVKLLLNFLAAFCLIFLLQVNAEAASVENKNGLEVSIRTDKDTYKENEDINVSVSIKNNNIFKISNISIETVIPDDLIIKSGNLNYLDIDIQAGETYTANFTAVKRKQEESKPEENKTDESKPDDNKPQETESENTEINNTDSPQTGDGFNYAFWIVLLVISGGVILFAVRNRKKATKVLGLFLCGAIIVTSIPSTIFAAENNIVSIMADKTITVEDKGYTIKTTIRYVGNGETQEEEKVYTKSEWIGLLADKLNINISADKNSWDFYYEDVRNDDNGIAIEAAHAYGLLPAPDIEDLEQDIPKFYPDSIADREFVAYTAVKAKGFEEDNTVDVSGWEDKNSVTYITEAAIAVKFDFLDLKGNKFEPLSPVTTNDIDKIFKAFDELDKSTVVTPENAHDSSAYKSDIVKESLKAIDDYTVRKVDNAYEVILPKNDETEKIISGNIIVLPENDENLTGYAFKVQEITENSESLVLKCIEPELSEVFESIDFAGKGTPVVGELIPAEGVTCEYDPNGSVGDENEIYPLNLDLGGSVSVPGTFKFEVEKEFSDDLKVSGSVEIEIPDVTCILDADIGLLNTQVNEFTFTVQEEIELKGELEYTLAESGYELTNSLGNTRWVSGRVELGRLPIAIGTTGLSFDIVFFYNTETKGTASITYTIDTKYGYQYKNGAGRMIFDYDDSLNLLELKGSAKAGLGVSGVLCALNMFDIIGYAGEFGIGFDASFTPHVLATDTLFCGDVTCYAYAKSGLDKETVVGIFLDKVCHYTVEFEHLKNDEHNPLKMKFHLENGKKVDECTFGTGVVQGYVFREDTREALQNARVKIYSGGNSGTNLVRTLYTDADGKFGVDNLNEGEYRVEVSATGYFTYDSNITVQGRETVYLEAFMMVNRNDTAELVNVSGNVKDAVTGSGLAETNYYVREGWDNTSGDAAYLGTFEYENFILQLPSGNYTLEVKKDGYVTNYKNIAVGYSELTNVNIVLSPQNETGIGDANGFRVVLTWGEKPEDLDSHLYGTSDMEMFHTYYANQSYYDYDDYKLMADLDVDDVSSYGPETTTVYELREDGIYSFLVHDFTNREAVDSTNLSMSGAKVQVYVDNVCICTFNIPMNSGGTVWHVFDYNATTDEIIPVNEFSYEANPENVLNVLN